MSFGTPDNVQGLSANTILRVNHLRNVLQGIENLLTQIDNLKFFQGDRECYETYAMESKAVRAKIRGELIDLIGTYKIDLRKQFGAE